MRRYTVKRQAIDAIRDRLSRSAPVAQYSYEDQMLVAEHFYLSMQKRGWRIVPKSTVAGKP